MAVVDTVQDHEVTWLKCPRCNGILPHMMSHDELQETLEPPVIAATTTAAAAVVTETPVAIPEPERATARDYEPGLTYQVGEIVYHRSLNAFGRVVEKTALAGHRAAIRVQFDGGDSMTLREGP